MHKQIKKEVYKKIKMVPFFIYSTGLPLAQANANHSDDSDEWLRQNQNDSDQAKTSSLEIYVDYSVLYWMDWILMLYMFD